MTALAGLGGALVGVLWMEMIMATTCLGLRLYTRLKIVRKVGWDDYMTVVAVFLFFLSTAIETASAVRGLGSHAATLSAVKAASAIKLEVVGMVFLVLAVGASKIAVAFVLLRIATRRRHTYFLWGCIAITGILLFSGFIAFFTQCRPLNALYDLTLPRESHFDFAQVATVLTSWTIILDFILALVPWVILARIDMSRKERLTICTGLSLGVFAGICGIIRVSKFPKFNEKSDFTFDTVPVILWTSSELLTTILCATVPAIRPLYKKIRPSKSTGSSESELFGGPTPDPFIDEKSRDYVQLKPTTAATAIAATLTFVANAATVAMTKASSVKAMVQPTIITIAAKAAPVKESFKSAGKTSSSAIAAGVVALSTSIMAATKSAAKAISHGASTTATKTVSRAASIRTAASEAASLVKVPERIHNPFKRKVTIYIVDDSEKRWSTQSDAFSALIGEQTLYKAK